MDFIHLGLVVGSRSLEIRNYLSAWLAHLDSLTDVICDEKACRLAQVYVRG